MTGLDSKKIKVLEHIPKSFCCGTTGVVAVVSWEHWVTSSIPGPAQCVKDPALPELQLMLALWLGSDPWPESSICHGVAKNEKKPCVCTPHPLKESTFQKKLYILFWPNKMCPPGLQSAALTIGKSPGSRVAQRLCQPQGNSNSRPETQFHCFFIFFVFLPFF